MRSSRFRWLAVAAMAAAGLGLAACAEEPEPGFTSDIRTGFMAACSVPVDDPRLVSDICQCVFAKTQVEIPYERFETIDTQLKADPQRPLSDEVIRIIADCVIEEADL